MTSAGAMRERVDILTAPRRETSRSSHGTGRGRGHYCRYTVATCGRQAQGEHVQTDPGEELDNVEHPG